MTIAEKIKATYDPYRQALLVMVFQINTPAASTIEMYFEDGSSITFQIRYEVVRFGTRWSDDSV